MLAAPIPESMPAVPPPRRSPRLWDPPARLAAQHGRRPPGRPDHAIAANPFHRQAEALAPGRGGGSHGIARSPSRPRRSSSPTRTPTRPGAAPTPSRSAPTRAITRRRRRPGARCAGSTPTPAGNGPSTAGSRSSGRPGSRPATASCSPSRSGPSWASGRRSRPAARSARSACPAAA